MSAKKLLTVLFAAVSLAVLSAGPALASGGWTATKVPSGAGPLASVSCWSSKGCLSVGSEALLWNGTAWTAIATPPGSKALDGVACTAASFCLAVGQNDSALAAAWKWNGTSWQSLVVYNPGSTDNVLNAVKCASATNCEAVGGHGDGSDSTTYPLAEFWNGSSMQKQSTYGAPHGELYGVSCESSSKCEAVGADFDGTSTDCIPPPDGAGCPVPDALAMGWTGTMWQTQATPVQPFMDYNNMAGPGTSNWQDTAVSCWSSGCMAPGWQYEASDPSSVQRAPYAEYWNGTSAIRPVTGRTLVLKDAPSRRGSSSGLVRTTSRSSISNAGCRLPGRPGAGGEWTDPIETRRKRVDAEASRLADLGATITGALGGEGLNHYAVGMKDPEGNEFDIN